MKKASVIAKRLLVAILIGNLVCPAYAFAGPLTPDPTNGKNPGIGTAGNGVPVVNITTPSGSGVSHNQYKDFNVGKNGLILNNSKTVGVSQLGGVIDSNKNLKNGQARLILNEVTGSDRSRIEGYIEVFGKSADVILANPNGVTINGGGFINVPRATVITGKPDMDGSGNLRGFDVKGGDVLVEGMGINASNMDGFDIVTRAAVINAQIHAKDLSITTGNNRYDPADRTATAIDGDESPAPAVAIDSRALGGMYANRIMLVSTEKGVGVNLEGVVQSVGDMAITADGKLVLKAAKAGGSMNLAGAGDVAVKEAAVADKNLAVSGKNISVSSGGALGAGENLTVTAQKNFDLAAGSQAASLNNTRITAKDVTAKNSLIQGASATIAAETVTASGVKVKALSGTGKATINAKNIKLADQSAVLAKNIDMQAERNLAVTDSQLESIGDSQYAFETMTASGANIYSGAHLSLTGTSLDLTDTKLAVEGAARLALGDISLTGSDIWSGDYTLLDLADSLTLDAKSSLIAHGGISLTAKDVNNHGLVYSGTAFEAYIENGFLNHTDAALLAQGDMVFTGWNGERMKKLKNESATIESLGGSLFIEADLLENVSAGEIKVKEVIDEKYYWALSINKYEGWDANGNEIVAEYGDHIGDGDKQTVWDHVHWMNSLYGFSTEAAHVKNHRTLQDWLYKTHQELDSEWIPSYLMAAGDVYIDAGKITNRLSTVSAGKNLVINADSLENIGVELTESLKLHRHMVRINNRGGRYDKDLDWHYNITSVYASIPAVMTAGETASITVAGTLDNSAVKVGEDFIGKTTSTPGIGDTGVTPIIPGEGSAPGLQLPLPDSLGAMFKVAGANHPYIIETDPRLTSMGVFFGSDYFFSTLGLDRNSMEMKVLGDAYYETTMIRQQIMQQTGQRYLQPGMGDAETVRGLMDNAYTQGQSLGLTVGVALTADQIKNLSADIVWMEETEYMGQKVLVPRVYLCEATLSSLGETRGAVISGQDTLITAGTVKNSGAIKGGNLLHLASDTDILNRGGDLFANTLIADASGSIINQSGSIRGGDIALKAGGDIISETVAQHRAKQGGYSPVMHQTAEIAATGNLHMVAGSDILLKGSSLTADTATISAGRDIIVASLGLAETHRDSKTQYARTGQLGATVNAGDLDMRAGRDMTIAGSAIAASNDATLVAGRDMTLTATENTFYYKHKRPGTTHHYESSQLTGASVTAGGNLTMKAGADAAQGPGNLVMIASSVEAKGDTALSATGNVILASATERDYRYEKKTKTGFLSKSTFSGEMEAITNKGSSVTGQNVSIFAGDNVLISASSVHADNDLAVRAEKGDIIATAAQDSLYLKTKEKKSKVNLGGVLGFGAMLPVLSVIGGDVELAKFSSKNTELMNITSVGSFLTAGNNISMDAGRDIGIIGSAVAADNDITLQAGRDVNLVPGREGFYSKSTKTKGSLGFSSSGLSINGGTAFVGVKVEKSGITHAGDYTSGSLVTAGNDVTIIAGRDVNQVSSHIAAGRDVYVEAGQDWVVAAAHDVENLHQWVKQVETGITVSARQNVTDAAKTVINMPHNATKGQGGAGYSLVTAGSAGLRAIDSVKGASSEYVSASGKIGASYTEHNYKASSSTAAPSSVSAGRDVIAFADRDITLEGARVNAGRDVILDAGRDVNIIAATNDSSSSFSSGGGGGGVGVKAVYGSGGGAFGVNVSANAHGAQGSGGGKEHTNAIVTAGDTLYISSGRDTNVKGAHLEGDKVWMDVGRDLNVESLQDSYDYNNSSWNAGIDVTIGYGAHVGGNVGVGKGSTSSQWVGQQTSIVGKSEVDIYVGKNTDIKGGLIYADNGNLKLDTETISYEAVKDKNKGSEWNMSVSGGAGSGQQGKVNYTPPVIDGSYASHDIRQVNRPTVGEGEIIVRSDPDATLDGLNRDITKAQEITKNEKKYTDIYLSKGAIEEAISGFEGIREDISKYSEQLQSVANKIKAATASLPENQKHLGDAGLTAMKNMIHNGIPSEIVEKVMSDSKFQEALGTLSGLGQYAEMGLDIFQRPTGSFGWMDEKGQVWPGLSMGSSFADQVIHTLVDVQKYVDSIPGQAEREAFKLGLQVVAGGPLKTIVGAAVGQAASGVIGELSKEAAAYVAGQRSYAEYVADHPYAADILKENAGGIAFGLSIAIGGGIKIKNSRITKIAKAESPVWKDLQGHKGTVKTSGTGKDKKYYEWDRTHGDIEVYNSNRKHLGSMDPITGKMIKPAVPGREISKGKI